MTQEEINTSNKLIAEFMGLAYCTRYNYTGWYKNAEFNHRVCDFDRLKYHSSWDWLIPVVEKIESLGFSSEIYCVGRFEHRTQFFSGGVCPFKSVLFKTKIESTYNALVEFINWYNTQNNDTRN